VLIIWDRRLGIAYQIMRRWQGGNLTDVIKIGFGDVMWVFLKAVISSRVHVGTMSITFWGMGLFDLFLNYLWRSVCVKNDGTTHDKFWLCSSGFAPANLAGGYFCFLWWVSSFG